MSFIQDSQSDSGNEDETLEGSVTDSSCPEDDNYEQDDKKTN